MPHKLNLSKIFAVFLLTSLLLLMYSSGVLFMPKMVVFLLLVLGAVLFRKWDVLLRDWFIFLSFVYLGDSLRGLIYTLTCKLGLPVQTLYPLRWEQALFGQVPSVTLQNALLKSAEGLSFSWLDKSLTVFYGSHFIVFLLVGFFIWLRKSSHFSEFKISFYFLIGAGSLSYLLVPTVPPWLASELFGLLPKLVHFNVIIFNASVPGLTTGFNTNPIAAMPSLHAAFPVLCGFILWRTSRWKSLPFQLYALIILFSIVYSGDHYVVDILAGVLLAAASYGLGLAIQKKRGREAGEVPETAGRPSFLQKNKRLFWGGFILAAGAIIGLTCKNQFERYPEAYDYVAAPRYADFFKHEVEFGENYDVQFYFGNHYLVRHEEARALTYFKKASTLSRTYMEKKKTEMKIRECQIRLGQRS